MFSDSLPANCPPANAQPQTISLFRLMVPDDLNTSFLNHVDLYPDNLSYKGMCDAHGLSFFDNLVKLKELVKKEINKNRIIAKVNITPEIGKLEKNNEKTGHYTLWLFKEAKLDGIKYEPVE